MKVGNPWQNFTFQKLKIAYLDKKVIVEIVATDIINKKV